MSIKIIVYQTDVATGYYYFSCTSSVTTTTTTTYLLLFPIGTLAGHSVPRPEFFTTICTRKMMYIAIAVGNSVYSH